MRSMADRIHAESDARRKKIYRRAAELAVSYNRDCEAHGVALTESDQVAVWDAALAVGQIEYSYGPRRDFTVLAGPPQP